MTARPALRPSHHRIWGRASRAGATSFSEFCEPHPGAPHRSRPHSSLDQAGRASVDVAGTSCTGIFAIFSPNTGFIQTPGYLLQTGKCLGDRKVAGRQRGAGDTVPFFSKTSVVFFSLGFWNLLVFQ